MNIAIEPWTWALSVSFLLLGLGLQFRFGGWRWPKVLVIRVPIKQAPEVVEKLIYRDRPVPMLPPPIPAAALRRAEQLYDRAQDQAEYLNGYQRGLAQAPIPAFGNSLNNAYSPGLGNAFPRLGGLQ